MTLFRVERLTQADLQDMQASRDRLAFDVRDQRREEWGTVVRARSRTCYDILVPGRAYPWEAVPTVATRRPKKLSVGERVLLMFLGPGVPVIMAPGDRTERRRFLGPEDIPAPDMLWPWRRLAISAAHRWYAAAWDDDSVPNSSIVFVSDVRISGGGALGGILRTDSLGVLWYTKGAELWSKSLAAGATSNENLVGTVQALSLCPLTERPYAWAGDFNPGESAEPAYEQGWTAGLDAFNAPGHGDNLESQGYNDCLESNPYLANDLAPYFWQVEVPPPEEPPVDPDDWGNYQQGWMDAIEAEVRNRYNAGWANAGCEVPEE